MCACVRVCVGVFAFVHALFQDAAVKIGKERCREIIAENNFGVDDFDQQRLNILALLAGATRFGFVGVFQVFKHIPTPNFTFILTPTSPQLVFVAQMLLRQSAVQIGHGPPCSSRAKLRHG